MNKKSPSDTLKILIEEFQSETLSDLMDDQQDDDSFWIHSSHMALAIHHFCMTQVLCNDCLKENH